MAFSQSRRKTSRVAQAAASRQDRGGELRELAATTQHVLGRVSRRCGAVDSPCVFKCKSRDTLFEGPKERRDLTPQRAQLLREAQRGSGVPAAEEFCLCAVLFLRELVRRSLFHFHVMKIEMYNARLGKHGRQSAGKSFVLRVGG